MNSRSYSRLASSLSIEELLNQPDSRPTQNWLLTYIDVFVLIVMLVVTLIALSNFESSQTTKQEKAHPKPIKIISKPKPPQPAAKAKAAEEIAQKAKLTYSAVKQEEPIIDSEKTQPLDQEVLQKTAIEKDTQVSEVEIQKKLNQQLEELGLTDSINMKITQGYAQLEIQDNILYKSSEAKLTESGQSVLKRLSPLLKQATGLIYIEGHTDDRPIKTTQFPSNWELGAARATSVLHFLASEKIEAARLRAVTYADTKPIADNKTQQGRQKNRRVNIVIKVSDKID